MATPAHAAGARPPLGPLGSLADLAVQRILLADKVAAAKFGTTQPIDDPVREQQVLDQVAATSASMGLPPGTSVRFFQAQIEANKVVQRALFQRWTEHPAEQPAERPDLAKEVRPQLDRITGQILEQLVNTREIRRPGVACVVWHAEAEISADIVNRLDELHRKAVAMSLRPVCEP
jgi:chorismate mutase